MVTVFVGPKRKEWILHERLLRDRSQYFKMAFRGTFAETSLKEIYLEEDDPTIFGLFVDYIYGGRLPGTCLAGSGTWLEAEKWCRLYVFADKIGEVTLRDQAKENYRLGAYAFHCPRLEEISFIYDNCKDGCDMRLILADRVAFVFFSSRALPCLREVWAKCMTYSIELNKDFAVAVSNHLKLVKDDCNISFCSAHS